MTSCELVDPMRKKPRTDLPLSDCWLSAIDSPSTLARRLSTPGHKLCVDDLSSFARDTGNYRLFPIFNEKGKARPIQWPKRRLQGVHARIHKLLSRVAVPKYLHSAVRGKSYISNAAAHDPKMPTIKIDVKKFFPSVSRVVIFNFFAGPLKCRRDVAGLLADILTFDAHLPTGSAASPIIAYYSFKPMFDEIAQFAESLGLTMTCYVDDMALSGPRANKGVLYAIRGIIARHGLKSHKAHTFSGLQPKVVTGVCNTAAGPRVPNKLHLKIKNGFDALAKAQNAVEEGKILRPLLGRMEAAAQIDPAFKARAKTVRAKYSRPKDVGGLEKIE
ncbi:Reverse transcriptase (RNA-dependent DNA polymerase) [Bradyrhizobium canariense]|uniref:Reverse transcriptase (RNA-dependent DNA polymerase) n=2 Tax=Bradyrhizobium canariense TaxID=255045 RepID=A0A1H2AGQ0_9BRAD|nr:Reverse transcriptase (RNA-dependent DNA polymerase) [Bradyrhizobium canariense]